MKKFLHLKKTIVESKNDPILVQTYLDSIRSSCYKLSIPELNACHSSPVECRTQPINVNSYVREFSNDAAATVNKHVPCSETNQKESQLSTAKKIDRIFQEISSHCKESSQKSYSSHTEIISKILEQLAVLEQNKDFHGPIQLIRKIIFSMNPRETTCETVGSPNTSFRKAKHATKQNQSHFKSLFSESPRDKPYNSFLKIKSVTKKKDNHKQTSKTQYHEEHNLIIEEPSLHSLNNSRNRSSGKSSDISKELVSDRDMDLSRFCTLKYQGGGPMEQFEGCEEYEVEDHSNPAQQQDRHNIDEIQIAESDEETHQTSEETNSSHSKLDNTMKSQDINQWCDLYKISQKEEEDENQQSEKSSNQQSDHENIPCELQQNDVKDLLFTNQSLKDLDGSSQQSIEFKKIRYMLESESTHKKAADLDRRTGIIKMDNLINRNGRNLFGKGSRNDKENELPLENSSRNSGRNKQSDDKSKAIKDIVSMLNNKYNRKITLRNA